jgi:hypothetical protein
MCFLEYFLEREVETSEAIVRTKKGSRLGDTYDPKRAGATMARMACSF